MKAFERETVIAWSDEDEDSSGLAIVTTYSPRWQRYFREQGYTSDDGVSFKVPIRGIGIWPATRKDRVVTRPQAWRQIARSLRQSALNCERIARTKA